MTPNLSAAEQATVDRFDAAQPAPESWGHPHHWIGTHDHGPVCSACGLRKPEGGDDGLREAIAHRVLGFVKDVVNGGGPSIYDIADALLALPEVAALRAKAAAADRVRELAETWQRCAADEAGADLRIWAGALRKALDGPPC